MLTLDHFREVFSQPTLVRGIINTILIGVIGGALAVACYTAIGLATHRKNDGWSRFVDYLVLVPRAVPGLLAGLAFLWVFLFFPPLAPLRTTHRSACGSPTRSSGWPTACAWSRARCCRSGPSSRRPRAAPAPRVARSAAHVTLPLIRYGLLASWLLVFMIFEREYSTGVYLLGPGTEVIGSLLVSLWGTGGADMVAALSLINVVLVGVGLAVALRFGVKLHD